MNSSGSLRREIITTWGPGKTSTRLSTRHAWRRAPQGHTNECAALSAYYYDLEGIREGLGTAFCRCGAVFGGGEIKLVRFLIGRDGAGAALGRDGCHGLKFLVDHGDGSIGAVGAEGVAVVEGDAVDSASDGRGGEDSAGGGIADDHH